MNNGQEVLHNACYYRKGPWVFWFLFFLLLWQITRSKAHSKKERFILAHHFLRKITMVRKVGENTVCYIVSAVRVEDWMRARVPESRRAGVGEGGERKGPGIGRGRWEREYVLTFFFIQFRIPVHRIELIVTMGLPNSTQTPWFRYF